MPVSLDGRPKTVEEIAAVASGSEKVRFVDEARQRVLASRETIESIFNSGDKVYGITTGFGKFADVSIPPDQICQLQENLVMSHATGTGPLFSREEVRAAMFLRANALARGMSGVRPAVIDALVTLINEDITPAVPEKGSVGASGDLAPLSHIALVLTGRGWAMASDCSPDLIPGIEACKRAGLEPLTLEAKEGLALTNGVQMTAAVLALTLHTARLLAKSADIVASLSGQALQVITDAFDREIVALRPQSGAAEVSSNMRRLLDGSGLSTRAGQVRVQDAYSLRCIPQVHGAVRQAISHVQSVVEIESGSATDNPLVLGDGRVISGGNFHGQPLAIAADYLALSMCSLSNISERRVMRLLDPIKSGLPPFLTEEPGLNSGLMIIQYTAAALASECKALAHPASVDTIPTSADQEDHVSMSPVAARKARDITDNVARVLAIEYLSACQALEFRNASSLSTAGRAAYELLRTRVSRVSRDREMSGDIEASTFLISSGSLVSAVEAVIGELL